MRRYLQLVATGPELSKSLNEEQAEDAMDMILNREVGPVRAALFLIALRMKRETDAENIGVLNSLMNHIEYAEADSPDIAAIADPFNGCLRGIPATPFMPAVFAACGMPAYIHGLESVGPKYGVTAKMIYKAANINVGLTPDKAVEKLDDGDCGWSYIDQSRYIPKLHDMVELRDIMVKRSCISTLEVVLRPISGARSTNLVTGFVHKAYPAVYASLARHAGFHSAALVRGVEGGCIPSLSQVSRYFGYREGGELSLYKLSPKALGIDRKNRGAPVPECFKNQMAQSCFKNTDVLNDVVTYSVETGIDALGNKPGYMRDSLIYGAAVGLKQFGVADTLQNAADIARRAIAGGDALARFKAAQC